MAGRWLILVDVEKPRIAGLFRRSFRQDRSRLEARPSPTRWRRASLRDPLAGNKRHREEHGHHQKYAPPGVPEWTITGTLGIVAAR
jgi:hypothetical protein